jgi:hypothetical protein
MPYDKRFLRETREVWADLSPEQFTEADCHEIASSMLGFFAALARCAKEAGIPATAGPSLLAMKMTTDNLPWSPEAEAAVLGAILIDGAQIKEATMSLTAEDFYDRRHQRIYATMLGLAKRGVGIDLVTVYDALRSTDHASKPDAAYLAGLCEAAPVVANLPHYAAIVRRDAILRRKVEAAKRFLAAVANGSHPDDEERAVKQLAEELIASDGNASVGQSRWLTAPELLGAQRTTVEWVWDGFLARGLLALLSARPKIGKTTLIFHFLKALFSRQLFLDRATRLDGKVLLLTEEAPMLLMRRLERFGLNVEDLLILQRFKVRSWPDAVEQIRLAAKQGVVLVIVDTLASFWGVVDENDAPKVVAALTPLQALLQELGVAGLLVHHLRKTPGEEGTAHRGSGAIVGAVDIAVEMTRDPAKPTRRVLAALSRFEETPQKLVIELTEGGVYRSMGSPEAVSHAEVTEQVLEALPSSEDEPIGRDELLERLDPKPSGSLLKEVLSTLAERERRIERLGAGKKGNPYRYRLAQDSNSATPIGSYVAESNSDPRQETPPQPPQSHSPATDQAIRLVQEVFPGTELCQPEKSPG